MQLPFSAVVLLLCTELMHIWIVVMIYMQVCDWTLHSLVVEQPHTCCLAREPGTCMVEYTIPSSSFVHPVVFPLAT